jgi:uncharacterized Zn-binding protein involved in type VI secretion
MGDKTDHGGHVISVSSGTVVMGMEAALADDMTYCPRCKGKFPIKPDSHGAKHQGRPYANHGDLTDCGAHLISSLTTADAACGSSGESAAEQGQKDECNQAFDDRFVLLNDESGEPAAFTEYAIEREDGRIEHGITNDRGETHLLSATSRPEKVRVYAAINP